jgi:hypothetical protein
MEMEPEDGLLFICDVDDDINVTAFSVTASRGGLIG